MTLRGYDLATRLKLAEGYPTIDHVAQLLRPFEGSTLCVPREVAEGERWDRLVKKAAVPAAPPRNSGGHPPDVFEPYLEAYRRLYPDGHAGKRRTVDQVWTDLIGATDGLSGSKSTVKRVIRAAKVPRV